MGAKNLKRAEGTPVDRVIRLISTLINANQGIPFDNFFVEDWGSERTMRRMLAGINEAWSYHRGMPLFEFIDNEGNPWTQGRPRFIRLKDTSVRTNQIANLALMPAFMQFMRILRGTQIENEFKELYNDSQVELTRKDRIFLKQAHNKFYYVAKGIKDYRGFSKQIGAIYQGLLNNRVLIVTRKSQFPDQPSITLRLRPLTLVNFNSGLYLLALNDKNPDEQPRKYRIETFEKAECSAETFIYPPLFDPEKYFADSFGIYSGKQGQEYTVRLAILTDSAEDYIRSRQWTRHDQYSSVDGKTVLSFRVCDLVEVTSWVLSFGDALKVLGPRELQKSVREKLLNAIHNYPDLKDLT